MTVAMVHNTSDDDLILRQALSSRPVGNSFTTDAQMYMVRWNVNCTITITIPVRSNHAILIVSMPLSKIFKIDKETSVYWKSNICALTHTHWLRQFHTLPFAYPHGVAML